jgi:hypothetical protein
MCVTRQRRFPVDATTPEASRNFAHAAVVAVLRPHGWAAADDVVIVVSELATEAFVAGATSIMVAIEVHYDHVAVVLRDDRQPDWRRRVGSNETRRLLLDALTMTRTAADDGEGTVNIARARCDTTATRGLPCRLRPELSDF